MNKCFIFFILLISLSSFSQNIKVTYSYRPSQEFEFEEHVFLNNGFKIGILDSLPIKKYPVQYDDGSINMELDKGIKQYRRILVDNLKQNDIYFTYQIKKKNYLITDNMPLIKWNINYKETKKIGKYICKKATTFYRGTNLEAYYTPEIPVSIGPYKFKGLPGLIMEIRKTGDQYYNYNESWVVKNIQYPFKGVPNYNAKYIKSLERMDLKTLVQKIDDRNDEETNIVLSKIKLPEGVGPMTTKRFKARYKMVEEKFEWE